MVVFVFEDESKMKERLRTRYLSFFLVNSRENFVDPYSPGLKVVKEPFQTPDKSWENVVDEIESSKARISIGFKSFISNILHDLYVILNKVF